MSEIKNGGLDQYGAEPFEQQQFGTAGVEGVNHKPFRHIFRNVFFILDKTRFMLFFIIACLKIFFLSICFDMFVIIVIRC